MTRPHFATATVPVVCADSYGSPVIAESESRSRTTVMRVGRFHSTPRSRVSVSRAFTTVSTRSGMSARSARPGSGRRRRSRSSLSTTVAAVTRAQPRATSARSAALVHLPDLGAREERRREVAVPLVEREARLREDHGGAVGVGLRELGARLVVVHGERELAGARRVALGVVEHRRRRASDRRPRAARRRTRRASTIVARARIEALFIGGVPPRSASRRPCAGRRSADRGP